MDCNRAAAILSRKAAVACVSKIAAKHRPLTSRNAARPKVRLYTIKNSRHEVHDVNFFTAIYFTLIDVTIGTRHQADSSAVRGCPTSGAITEVIAVYGYRKIFIHDFFPVLVLVVLDGRPWPGGC
jgi:hypothetical protein